MDSKDDLIELCRTFNPAELMTIQSLLESEDIQYFVQGEESLWLRPGLPAMTTIVFVRRDDLEQAQLLIQEPE